MIRKISLLAVIFYIVLLNPAMVQAAEPIAVETSVQADFPQTLSFLIRARSATEITDIRLHYQVERVEYAEVTSEAYVEFGRAKSVETRWDWDMRKTGGLPPGSKITYWWTLKDAGGNTVDTEPFKMTFDDNRYSWQSVRNGKVTLYWYKGDNAFAEKMIAAVQDGESRLMNNTGARLENPAQIYIYASPQDLRGSMIFPQEWTGGVTFTRYDTIAIGIAPDQLEWGSRAIAHELTHLVVDQVTSGPYASLPTWLNEGLAMYAEGPLEAGYASLLKRASDEDALISVRSLSSPFSAFGDVTSLSYAESYSIISFLIKNYGKEKMFGLLQTFKQGSGYDEALEKTYGFDMDGLDTSWRQSIIATQLPVGEGEINPVLVGLLFGIGALALLLLSLFLEDWTWKHV